MATAQQREVAEHQLIDYGRRMRKRAETAEGKLNAIAELTEVYSEFVHVETLRRILESNRTEL